MNRIRTAPRAIPFAYALVNMDTEQGSPSYRPLPIGGGVRGRIVNTKRAPRRKATGKNGRRTPHEVGSNETKRRSLRVTALEPRILLSATWIDADQGLEPAHAVQGDASADCRLLAVPSRHSSHQTVVALNRSFELYAARYAQPIDRVILRLFTSLSLPVRPADLESVLR